MGRYEHFHHQADIGVRGVGSSPAEAFAQAALALTAVMVPPESVQPEERVELAMEAEELDILLYDFLNALVYETATTGLLFGHVELDVSKEAEGWRLRGAAFGEKIEHGRHSPAVEIKAATFTKLAARQEENGDWLAQCVVDV